MTFSIVLRRALFGAAAAVSLVAAGAAHAVTLSVTGGHHDGPGDKLPGNYSLPTADGIGIGSSITWFGPADTGNPWGLSVDQNAQLKFEYVGSEAGFRNLAISIGNFTMDNKGAHNTATFTFGPGYVPFYFKAVDPGNKKAINDGATASGRLVAFAQVSAPIYYAFFDDGGGGPPSDKDFDDFVLKITATCLAATCNDNQNPPATPLPAAVWL